MRQAGWRLLGEPWQQLVATEAPDEGNLHVRICGGGHRGTGALTRNLTASSLRCAPASGSR
jgi:hypothetical protein